MNANLYRSAIGIHLPKTTHLSKTFWTGDIALLELDQALDFDNRIRPICLASEFREKPGEMALFAGWGNYRSKRIFAQHRQVLFSRSDKSDALVPTTKLREDVLFFRRVQSCGP